MRRAAIVFVGGGVGACLRGLLLSWLAPLSTLVPLPVLVANVLGAFILGMVYSLADEAGLLRVETRLFLAVGMLGGFTTFSTFAWGTDVLLARSAGAVGAAVVYVVASVMGGVVAVGAGQVAGREAIATLERTAEGLLGRLQERGLRRAGKAREDIGSIEAEDRGEDADHKESA